MRVGACTIIAKNYLPYARALMASVERWHPEWSRFVVLVDAVDGYFDPENEIFEVILSGDLDLPDSRWFHFKYNILELSTAVKPFAIAKLLRDFKLDAITYLDPDIQLFKRLEPVSRAWEDSDIILTPHLTSAVRDSKKPGELEILRTGVYNLGFITLTNREPAERFLEWWSAKLEHQCLIDPERGLFVDQRWCDLVPGLFERVRILRDPGLNVAYWNLSGRGVKRDAGRYLVNGEPLYFFHFSGFDPENPNQFSRYQDRFRLSELGDAYQLVWAYREEVLQRGYQECKNWPYKFGYVADGTPIPDVMRPILTENPSLASEISDPFSSTGFREICKTWNEPLPDPGGPPFFTRLANRIYTTSAGVRAAYPDVFGRDRESYLSWLAQSSAKVYGTPEAVNVEFAGEPRPSTTECRGPASVGNFDSPGLKVSREERARNRIHQLMYYIYDSRPDLQAAFPDSGVRDRLDYLTWLCTFGRTEYEFNPEDNSVMHHEWEKAIKACGSPIKAFRQRIRRMAYGRWTWIKALVTRQVPQSLPGGLRR